MRRWLSLTTVLALLLCINGYARDKRGWPKGDDHTTIEPCPSDSVCLIFGGDKCTVGGEETGVYMWQEDTFATCENKNYQHLFARLDIRPINATKWEVVTTLRTKGDYEYKPEEYRFNFGKSELTFTSSSEALFSWNQGQKTRSSNNSISESTEMVSRNTWHFIPIPTSSAYFVRFSFDVMTHGEKLLAYIGSEVTLHVDNKDDQQKLELNETAFPERLNNLTFCDVSEINEICYDTCDKILVGLSDSNSTESTKLGKVAICTSQLWFHSPSDGGMSRQWKKITPLACHMGWWIGATTNGIQQIDRSLEVQCSGPEPSKLTSLAKIVIGVGAGIGGLILIGIIVVIVFFLSKKRKGENFGGNTEKKFTIRDSDSRAQTPGTPGGKSTEREKN